MDFSYCQLFEMEDKFVEMFGKLILFVIKCIYSEVSVGVIDYSRCGEEIQIIEIGYLVFVIVVLNVSGDIVVLDEEERCVYVYILQVGCFILFCIRYGDLWDIIFFKDDEIIVLNRECNRLFYYDREGIFIKKYVKVLNNRVKFIRIFIDVIGRLLVILSFRDCCDELEDEV